MEAPVEQRAPREVDLGTGAGILQPRQGGLGRQEVELDGGETFAFAARGKVRTAPFEKQGAAAARQAVQRFRLDLRLEGERGHGRHAEADLEAVGEKRRPLRRRRAEFHLHGYPQGLVPRNPSGPEDRLHAAFAGDLGRQGAAGCELGELQRAVEVGLARAVGADEDGQRLQREGDAADRTVVRDRDAADGQRHQLSVRRSSGRSSEKAGISTSKKLPSGPCMR